MVKEKKSSLLALCKRCIAQKRQNLIGTLNGDIPLFLLLSQALKGRRCYDFNNNFHLQILKHSSDPEGRFIIADIDTGDKIMTLVNVYAPNEDNPAFFR